MYTVAADLQAPPTDAIDVKELSRFQFASHAPSGDPKQRSPSRARVPTPAPIEASLWAIDRLLHRQEIA
jgi:hypothetical protein